MGTAGACGDRGSKALGTRANVATRIALDLRFGGEVVARAGLCAYVSMWISYDASTAAVNQDRGGAVDDASIGNDMRAKEL